MNTQIEKSKNKEGTIIDLIRSPKVQQEWALVLTKYLDPERLARVAISQLKRVPKLAQCDQSSLFNALMTCAELELEPDGRRVHLIPFENRKNGTIECQLIVDYKGLIELARRSKLISNIYADVICENDEFEWDLGQVVKHKIDIRKPRGEFIGAYARMLFKDGTVQCELMSKDDIENIKLRSKAGNFGPWKTDYNEMAKKTVLRRLLKTAPMGSKESMALEKEQDSIDFKNENLSMNHIDNVDESIFEIETTELEIEE